MHVVQYHLPIVAIFPIHAELFRRIADDLGRKLARFSHHDDAAPAKSERHSLRTTGRGHWLSVMIFCCGVGELEQRRASCWPDERLAGKCQYAVDTLRLVPAEHDRMISELVFVATE